MYNENVTREHILVVINRFCEFPQKSSHSEQTMTMRVGTRNHATQIVPISQHRTNHISIFGPENRFTDLVVFERCRP